MCAALLSCLPLGAAAMPAAAVAGPVETAVEKLRGDSVFLDPASGRNVDVDAARAAIGDEPIKIAIIPKIDSVAEVAALPRRLARDLPGNTIAVISGRYFYAGSEVTCEGHAGRAAANAINANEAALDANPSIDSPSDITRPLTDFVTEIKSAPRCPQQAGRADRYAGEPDAAASSPHPDDTASVLPWVLGGLAVAVAAVTTLVLLARGRRRGEAVQVRTEAAELVQRLGDELAELPVGDGGQAAEAAARHGEAEAILIGATTDTQFAAARQAAIEGLTAARAARVALGREPESNRR